MRLKVRSNEVVTKSGGNEDAIGRQSKIDVLSIELRYYIIEDKRVYCSMWCRFVGHESNEQMSKMTDGGTIQ
jgi:hypothetical protein